MFLIPLCVLFAFASAQEPGCRSPRTYYKANIERSGCTEVRQCQPPNAGYTSLAECRTNLGLEDDDLVNICQKGMKPYYSQSLRNPSAVTCVHKCLANPPPPGGFYESEEACRKNIVSKEDLAQNGKCTNPKKGVYYRIMGERCVGICFDGVPKDRSLYYEKELECQNKLAADDDDSALRCLQDGQKMYITWDANLKMCTTSCMSTPPEKAYDTMTECSQRQRQENSQPQGLSEDDPGCPSRQTYYTWFNTAIGECKSECLSIKPATTYLSMQQCLAENDLQEDPAEEPAQPQPPTQDCVHIYYVKSATGKCQKECESAFQQLNVTESYKTLSDCQSEITRLMRLKVEQEKQGGPQNPQLPQPAGGQRPLGGAPQPAGPQPPFAIAPQHVPPPPGRPTDFRGSLRDDPPPPAGGAQPPVGTPGQPGYPGQAGNPQQPGGAQPPVGTPGQPGYPGQAGNPRQPGGAPPPVGTPGQPGSAQPIISDVQDDFPFAFADPSAPNKFCGNYQQATQMRQCISYSCSGVQLQCLIQMCDRQQRCQNVGSVCPLSVPKKFKKLCKF